LDKRPTTRDQRHSYAVLKAREVRDTQKITSKPAPYRERLSREYDCERDYLGDREGGDPRELRFE
jgi:hypothetical protein